MHIGISHSQLLGGKMNKLFNPRSVAIIGASSNPNKWGNWLAEQVSKHKESRKVYFINPKKEIVFGVPCLRCIDHIPEPIEVAVVVVPPDSFENAVDELLNHGTDIIVGITSEVSIDVQKRVATKCINNGTYLIGPNCAGLWSKDFYCWPREFNAGPVSVISQSGGVVIDLYERLIQVGLGFSKVLSIGNQNDLSFIDVLPTLENDPETKVIVLYVEQTNTIPHTYIKTMTKPVFVLSAQPTPMAKEAALLHTNSQLKEDDQLFINSISDLVERLKVIMQLLSQTVVVWVF
jgi:acetate---CoA ligase (ADP-forming)